MNCQDQIYSEEYIDFIGNRSLIESKYTLDCKQPLGARFASLYLKLSDGYEDGTVYGLSLIHIFAMDEVDLIFEPDALEAIAAKALKKDTGARALRAIIEDFMLDIMYEICLLYTSRCV